MPLMPAAPPVPVQVYGGFDYVTVDAQRRRVYAAHGGSRALLVVDADSGKVLGQVRVGPAAGVAVDPATGNVYTGNGIARSVSEIDPVTFKEVRSVDVAGPVDAIAYDARTGRIYADEDDGTRIFVIDAKTFKQVATIAVPGHKPEYLAINAAKNVLYQNIDTLNEFVVIDLASNKVVRAVPTPALQHNHPLQYDAAYDHILVGGVNGVLGVYDSQGKQLYTLAVPERIDQCSLDQSSHLMACAGSAKITLIKDNPNAAPEIVAQLDVPRGMHTVGIDPKTGDIWGVWAAPEGDFVQRFTQRP